MRQILNCNITVGPFNFWTGWIENEICRNMRSRILAVVAAIFLLSPFLGYRYAEAAVIPGLPPTGFVGTNLSGIIRLSWAAPDLMAGDVVERYYVHVAGTRILSGSDVCEALPPATTCDFGVASNIGTTYNLVVTAVTTDYGATDPSSSITVTAMSVPVGPTIVGVLRQDRSAAVSWTSGFDGASPITSYTVTSRPGGFTCTVAAPASSCVVTGLTNGSIYSFNAFATNAMGDGPVGSSYFGIAAAPTGLTATVSSGSVRLSWTAPAVIANNGAPITSYTVTAAPGSATCTAAVPATNCSVTGLTNGTAYSFTVRATNAAGDGLQSSSVSATPVSVVAGAPTGLTATASSGSVQLSWTAPASDGGSPITSYTVTAAPGGATCTVAAPATTCSITGLTNGTAYSFTVKATNAAGDSVGSSSVSATPASSVPEAPTGLAGTVGHQAVQLSWNAPASSGGSVITGYTVTAAPGGGTCTAVAPATTCIVTGLTNGMAYTFTVKATNAQGDGAASTGVTLTPQLQVQVLSLPSAGVATVKLGLPPGCALNSATINTQVPAGTPGNATAPLGALRFIATGSGCANATVPVQIDYPAGSLAGLAPHKYGPANVGGEVKWFVYGVVSGDSVSYSVTDNGVGDNDAVIGNISDPFAPLLTPVQSGAQSVPTLNEWGVILLSMLVGGFAYGVSRRKTR